MQILNFVKDYPTYGPERTEAELKESGVFVGHTGICNVLKKTGDAHLQKNLTLDKQRDKIKIPELIRGEKEVEEKNLTFAYDSVKKSEKEDAIECQFVTTS